MATTSPPPSAEEEAAPGFLDHILTPGSSLHPTALLILNGAFASLFCVFFVLLFLTGGSIHVVVLMLIELCLWLSVKWFIEEYKKSMQGSPEDDQKKKDD